MMALLWQRTWPVFLCLALWVVGVLVMRAIVKRYKGMQ